MVAIEYTFFLTRKHGPSMEVFTLKKREKIMKYITGNEFSFNSDF